MFHLIYFAGNIFECEMGRKIKAATKTKQCICTPSNYYFFVEKHPSDAFRCECCIALLFRLRSRPVRIRTELFCTHIFCYSYKICIQTYTSVCFELIQCTVLSSLTHCAQVETRWEGATLRAARGARRRQWRERRGFIALPRRLRAEVYRWTPFRLCYGPGPDPAARTSAARTPCGGSFSQQVGPRSRRDSRR